MAKQGVAAAGPAPLAPRFTAASAADKDFILAAVSADGLALEFAHPLLRNDRDVVLAAVACRGDALEFASARLRADRGVVLAAVSKHGLALRFASAALRGDRAVVAAAAVREALALEFASEELRKDASFAVELAYGPARLAEAFRFLDGAGVAQEAVEDAGRPRKRPKLALLDLADFECPVCHDLPPGEVRQCPEGHVICEGCLSRLPQGCAVSCPICRVAVPRSSFGRNRFLEQQLALVALPCPHGCGARVKATQFSEHERLRCGHRPTPCPACAAALAARDLCGHALSCPKGHSSLRFQSEHFSEDVRWGSTRLLPFAGGAVVVLDDFRFCSGREALQFRARLLEERDGEGAAPARGTAVHVVVDVVDLEASAVPQTTPRPRMKASATIWPKSFWASDGEEAVSCMLHLPLKSAWSSDSCPPDVLLKFSCGSL